MSGDLGFVSSNNGQYNSIDAQTTSLTSLGVQNLTVNEITVNNISLTPEVGVIAATWSGVIGAAVPRDINYAKVGRIVTLSVNQLSAPPVGAGTIQLDGTLPVSLRPINEVYNIAFGIDQNLVNIQIAIFANGNIEIRVAPAAPYVGPAESGWFGWSISYVSAE